MTLFNDITETIGETPMVKLNKIVPDGSNVYVKIERNNPGGSIKDRAVLSMFNDAEAKGIISKGSVIIEPTSGNTGIAAAMIAAVRGYRCIMVMPDTMSKERVLYMKAYGAEIVFTPGAEGMVGSINKAEEIAAETGGMILGQFFNSSNPDAHAVTTGREILRDLPDADYIVAGFGTGGTVTGIGRIVKESGSKAKIIAVEPAESPLITEGKAGPHKIQGIGANFIPDNLDKTVISEFVTVEGDIALEYTAKLAREEGIFAGISSGASVAAAVRLAKEHPGSKIVAILPDGGDKYISTGVFD